jgi:hypothetical protein
MRRKIYTNIDRRIQWRAHGDLWPRKRFKQTGARGAVMTRRRGLRGVGLRGSREAGGRALGSPIGRAGLPALFETACRKGLSKAALSNGPMEISSRYTEVFRIRHETCLGRRESGAVAITPPPRAG